MNKPEKIPAIWKLNLYWRKTDNKQVSQVVISAKEKDKTGNGFTSIQQVKIFTKVARKSRF